MTNSSDAAVELFRRGCACSQAVLGAFAPRFGLDPAVAAKLAVGFAGGMRRGETCGAVTGAYMVLGLAHAGEDCDTAAGRARPHDAVTALAAAFEQRHGSLHCKVLLGFDVTTPDGRAAAKAAGVMPGRCEQYVAEAARLVEDSLAPANAVPAPAEGSS